MSDILPDASRNRYYVLRQDQNQLLIFDGGSNNVVATLPTATSPTMMSMTSDQNYLLVGHNDSQYVTIYDLNAMAPVTPPIVLPGGHYCPLHRGFERGIAGIGSQRSQRLGHQSIPSISRIALPRRFKRSAFTRTPSIPRAC